MGNFIEYMSMDDSYSYKFKARVEKIIYQHVHQEGRSMESRVAKLESDVGYIKSDIIDLKSDVKILKSDTNDIKTNIAIMIHRIDGIVNSIAKLPTEDKINTKFAEINTEIVKTNCKIELESAKLETKIKDTRLQIILWVLGLPAFLYSAYRVYLLYLTNPGL